MLTIIVIVMSCNNSIRLQAPQTLIATEQCNRKLLAASLSHPFTQKNPTCDQTHVCLVNSKWIFM